MSLPPSLESPLRAVQSRWLVTGAAGFIGSNLVEALLRHGQAVRGLDDLSQGLQQNLDLVREKITPKQWARFEFVQGDIRDVDVVARACSDTDYVLHQAALGSVPASLADPAHTHDVNVTGTLNVFLAARDHRVRRVVYASSCAVYGNQETLPVTESLKPDPQSPYAASKLVNELYARTMRRCFDLPVVGLRYFNVFGPRQNPSGPYAAVIPLWRKVLQEDQPVIIYGDGLSTRDFCFVTDVVQANLLAALVDRAEALDRVYNIGTGQRASLMDLLEVLQEVVGTAHPPARDAVPVHKAPRPGDIRHSQADIGLARRFLGYAPAYSLQTGIREWLAPAQAVGRPGHADQGAASKVG